MRLRTRVLVLLAVLAPALALCLLGLRSLRADAVESRRQAADRAHRLRDDLQLDLERALADVQGLVEAGDLPDLAFRIDGAGRILDPATRSFPATARSFAPGDLVALRGFLEKADRAIYRLDDPEGAIALLAPAEGLFEDEDLAAVLRERTALAYEKAGQLEEAARLYLEILDEHPEPATSAAARWPCRRRSGPSRCSASSGARRRPSRRRGASPRSSPRTRGGSTPRSGRCSPGTCHPCRRRCTTRRSGASSCPSCPRCRPTRAGRRFAAGRPAAASSSRTAAGPGARWRARCSSRTSSATASRTAPPVLAALAGAEAALDDGRPRPGAEVVRGPLASPFEGIAVVVAVRPDRREVVLALVWAACPSCSWAGSRPVFSSAFAPWAGRSGSPGCVRSSSTTSRHELRTPLASIRALAENLEGRRGAGRATTRVLQRRSRESQRVTRLVEDVLDLSRLDRGDGLARRTAIEPAGLAREAVGALAHADGAGDYEVRLEVDDELPELRGDRDALRRALLNLLVNAARYSPRVREGELEVRRRGRNVAWTVRDRGPGIPAEEHEAIFLRYHRVSSETHEVKGTGLGLPLARAIVEAHGGSLTVESEPGRGSAFTITLPVEEER
jgi:anti-sigma regulatory factor (Ser/Thr protein kinase)